MLTPSHQRNREFTNSLQVQRSPSLYRPKGSVRPLVYGLVAGVFLPSFAAHIVGLLTGDRLLLLIGVIGLLVGIVGTLGFLLRGRLDVLEENPPRVNVPLDEILDRVDGFIGDSAGSPLLLSRLSNRLHLMATRASCLSKDEKGDKES